MELVSKLVLGRGKRVDDSLRAGLGQDRATCHSGGLSGILGGREKKSILHWQNRCSYHGARHDDMDPGYDVCLCAPSQPH